MAAGNTFGTMLKLTLFGESHGVSVGAVLDGFPSGRKIDLQLIEEMLQQRSPQGLAHETSRSEADEVEFLSGVVNGVTLGSPIAFIIRNKNAQPEDYFMLKNVFRPGHADYVYYQKYGILPQSGGGRASGRETAARVVAGAIALDFLRKEKIDIISYVSAIGEAAIESPGKWYGEKIVFADTLRCPVKKTAGLMQKVIDEVTANKDSIGGKITTVVKGLPAGVGEPVFGKLNAVLSQAAMSIPGAKGTEFGEGFGGLAIRGSAYNDAMVGKNETLIFSSNHSGGIQAGISNGNLLVMNTAFRPPSSIGQKQMTANISGKQTEIVVGGRHDACFVPRAAIVVTAMTALALMDLWLQFKSYERK